MYLHVFYVETCVAHVAQRGRKRPLALSLFHQGARRAPYHFHPVFSQGGFSRWSSVLPRAPLYRPFIHSTLSFAFFNFKSLFLDPVSWSLDLPLEAPREPHWSVGSFLTLSRLLTCLFIVEIFFFPAPFLYIASI